jgi:hypothetical protein
MQMAKLDLPEQVAEQPLPSAAAQELVEQTVEMASAELRAAQQLALAAAEAHEEHFAVPGVSRDSPVRHII